MSVYRRVSARGRVTWYYDFWAEGRRYVKAVGPHPADARRAEAIRRAQLYDQRLQRDYGFSATRATPVTVRTLVTQFLQGLQARHLAPSSQRRARVVFTPFLRAFGKQAVRDLTPGSLQAYQVTRAKSVSANGLRYDLLWLRRLLRVAQAQGLLRQDLLGGVRPPHATPPPDRVLTPVEETRLLAALRIPQHRVLIRLYLLTGLRPGELPGIRWGQVDLDEAVLTIRELKTGRTRRVPLVPEAIRLLRSILPAGQSPEAPVFPTPRGGPLTWRGVLTIFHRARVRAGLPEVRLHDLRHTVATRLAQQGEDLATIGAILGHRPPYRATLRYIAHTAPVRLQHALAKLSQAKSQRVSEKRQRFKVVR